MAGGGLQFPKNSKLPHGLVWCGADPGKLKLQPVILCAALLILVLATSAFGCATGWRSEPGTFCFRQSSREACAGKKPALGFVFADRTFKFQTGKKLQNL
jgi:hypothetical protein